LSIQTYGSLFAGAGGIDIGLDSAGLQCKFQVEWDSNCQETLKYHWPTAQLWGDISNVNGKDLVPVDLITFGSPCQDLSNAGKKVGLKGSRSNLFFEAIRVIKEMKESTGGEYPKIAIWENVTGAMSSNGGDDFETVIKEMAGLGSYHLEWSVLDAQYFGVPQKRRRVFVIAILDPAIARRSPQQILPVEKSSKGNPKKGIKQENEYPKELASCLRSGGEGGVPSSRGENLVVDSKGVRRFTPIECERLMGWPTNHTLYRADGKTNSDNTRYKMCGNGVASPVIKWVVDQIKKI